MDGEPRLRADRLDGAFVASEVGTYRIVGAFAGRSATATVTVCRAMYSPHHAGGTLPVKNFSTVEFWLHPDGKYGYLSTLGDRLYAIDLSDPASPVITDSVMVDARVINDVMTTEDGKYGVHDPRGRLHAEERHRHPLLRGPGASQGRSPSSPRR